jgi:hypothetical protein
LRLCVCVSLGLKKPGDFTVSEGHRYPLVGEYQSMKQCKQHAPNRPSLLFWLFLLGGGYMGVGFFIFIFVPSVIQTYSSCSQCLPWHVPNSTSLCTICCAQHCSFGTYSQANIDSYVLIVYFCGGGVFKVSELFSRCINWIGSLQKHTHTHTHDAFSTN